MPVDQPGMGGEEPLDLGLDRLHQHPPGVLAQQRQRRGIGDARSWFGQADDAIPLRGVSFLATASIAEDTPPPASATKIGHSPLVRPFANMLACAVMDLPAVEPGAIGLLETCVRRVLRHEVWDEARRRRGEVYGFDLPDLVRILLFVQVEHAGGAARFANGGWREVASVLPVVDPFVRAVGDVPADLFVEQVSVVLARQPEIPVGWRGSTIPGRVAALLQEFAQRERPLPAALA